jgi:hypothetical protein
LVVVVRLGGSVDLGLACPVAISNNVGVGLLGAGIAAAGYRGEMFNMVIYDVFQCDIL